LDLCQCEASVGHVSGPLAPLAPHRILISCRPESEKRENDSTHENAGLWAV
jgi:hypothetical protein